MGNGLGKKPPFPGIDSRANAQSHAPQTWHGSAVLTRARKYPRNHVQRRDNFYGPGKRKKVA